MGVSARCRHDAYGNTYGGSSDGLIFGHPGVIKYKSGHPGGTPDLLCG